MTVTGREHLYERPRWDCRICKQPWPCPIARANLAEEFRDYPSTLIVYMSAQMHDALLDLAPHGGSAPLDLYERFLSWVGR